MPGRKVPLITGETYHVFNRGIDHRTTFSSTKEFERAITVISYYLFFSPPVKLSKYLNLPVNMRSDIIQALEAKQDKLVNIYSFCLMPNHIHFLLTQLKDNGIAKFMANIQNSYTRYFNTKHERIGPLFLNQFKAVHVQTDEQFIHVSRYIHLNPLTGYVVKKFSDLYNYPWSSFNEYLGNSKQKIATTEHVISFFKSKLAYECFLADQVDYQRTLSEIKHLLPE